MSSIVGRLRAALAAGSALLLARAEFATAELSQAGATALRWLLTSLLALGLVMLALIAFTAAVVLALWDAMGWYSLGVLALAYAVLACFIVVRLVREIRASPPVLAQTFAELAKDREALFGQDAGTRQEPSP